MKFIGVPVRVKESSNPFFTPKGALPVIRDGRNVLTNFEEVVEYLKSLVSLHHTSLICTSLHQYLHVYVFYTSRSISLVYTDGGGLWFIF